MEFLCIAVFGSFMLTVAVLKITIGIFAYSKEFSCLQQDSVYNKHFKGLQAKKTQL